MTLTCEAIVDGLIGLLGADNVDVETQGPCIYPA